MEADPAAYAHAAEGRILATLFYEPSTRTRLSFQAAINRVGASCIDLGSASASSQAKGETWQDTIKTVDGYVDAIVMRTPIAGAAQEAAAQSTPQAEESSAWDAAPQAQNDPAAEAAESEV